MLKLLGPAMLTLGHPTELWSVQIAVLLPYGGSVLTANFPSGAASNIVVMKATFLSIACLCSGVVSYPSQSALVYTSSGPVRGHAAPRAPGVTAYLGIPYAEAPVGDLRFAPPQPFRSNSNGRRTFGDDLVSLAIAPRGII